MINIVLHEPLIPQNTRNPRSIWAFYPINNLPSYNPYIGLGC